MSRPDPLIMSADIARVAGERPEMGDELVRALYQHLVLIEGRQPTIDELREYVNRLSSLDDHVLRQQLGLDRPKRSHRPRTVERRADRTRTSVVERHDDRRAPAHADDAEPTGRGSAARARERPGPPPHQATGCRGPTNRAQHPLPPSLGDGPGARDLLPSRPKAAEGHQTAHDTPLSQAWERGRG